MVLLDQACQQIRGVRLDMTVPDEWATFELLRRRFLDSFTARV